MNSTNCVSTVLAGSVLSWVVAAQAALVSTTVSTLPLEPGQAPPSSLAFASSVRGQTRLHSSIPTPSDGVDIAALLGAESFYGRGIAGQGTQTVNIEAGHMWNGHQTLQHVSDYFHDSSAWDDPTTPGQQQSDLYDVHATAVGMILGGRFGGDEPSGAQAGIAPGTNLASGAIASQFVDFSSGAFDITPTTFTAAYSAYFGQANVINSSWGFASPFLDEFGASTYTVALDGMAFANPGTSLVIAAGNEADPDFEPSTPPIGNSVIGPASGYNSITVGALQNDGHNGYNSVSAFSSRGPQAFHFIEIVDDFPVLTYCLACRASIDIVAPGTDLRSAAYFGPTGSNNPTLPDTPGFPPEMAEDDFRLFSGLAGTSFASPIVAGAAALLHSARGSAPELAANPHSGDARVIKAVLMNSADKLPGWSNAPFELSFGGPNFIATTQALDFTSGAGALNIGRSYDQYLADGATKDVDGVVPGTQGMVGEVGWDFGKVETGNDSLYFIEAALAAGSTFTATLAWFREREFDLDTSGLKDVGQADLDLYLIDALSGDIIAASGSSFNTVEHIHIVLPTTSQYLMVVNFAGAAAGAAVSAEYGFAWSAVAVPEPCTATFVALAATVAFRPRRRKAHAALALYFTP